MKLLKTTTEKQINCQFTKLPYFKLWSSMKCLVVSVAGFHSIGHSSLSHATISLNCTATLLKTTKEKEINCQFTKLPYFKLWSSMSSSLLAISRSDKSADGIYSPSLSSSALRPPKLFHSLIIPLGSLWSKGRLSTKLHQQTLLAAVFFN